MRYPIPLALFFGGLALWAAVPVNAQVEPEDAIKYRQAYMKALGGHSAAVSLLAKDKFAAEGHLKMHVQAIAQLSKDMLAVFPKGSDFGETRAKSEIWQKWDGFKKLVQDNANAAADLLKAAESGNKAEIADRASKLGETCKACHKDFRAEEK